jgi:peptidoglycan hydrolase-like protein with peptidoglycan-binding domain
VRVQSQLANLGYYRGVVDGAYGPMTNRAVLQYQADNGLPVTGRLDRATLKSLGV